MANNVLTQMTKARQPTVGPPRNGPLAHDEAGISIDGYEILRLQRKIGNRATTQLLNTRGFRRHEGKVQRKCSSCGGGTDLCDECQKDSSIRRKSNGVAEAQPDVGTAVREGLVSQGQPLDPPLRASMESYFGHDLAGVRVHADSNADASAKLLNADAYTIGRDIVFGNGRYQPHTPEGQRLLAHELTHTIQQTNGTGYDHIGISTPNDSSEKEADAVADSFGHGESISRMPASHNFAVARQPAGQSAGSPSSQPAGQPATPGWQGCQKENISSLPNELAQAINWVQKAVDDLSAKEISGTTKAALSRYLSSDTSDVTATILPKLKLILTELQLGATNFQCQTEAQCLAQFPSGAVAFSGTPITLCPSYFDEGNLDRVSTLIHEAGHNAGLAGNVIESQWHFPGLDQKDRLGNTDSYAAFARSNKYPSIAPYEQGVGPKVSFGVSAPGGTGISPRFLVRVEEDIVLKRRVFRFMDLHLGIGLEFDSSGSFLGKASFTTRSFAPLSLTKVPLYLDLGAGGVVGGIGGAGKQFRGVGGVDLNVGGVSAEAGLGVHSGRVGVGISYTHIFNFLKQNPDINQIAVNGEILF